MSAVIVGGGEGSKISCRICGDTAVKHVHYGGHCCFSCKAFFRYNNNNNNNGVVPELTTHLIVFIFYLGEL